jgi:hypothetical protein
MTINLIFIPIGYFFFKNLIYRVRNGDNPLAMTIGKPSQFSLSLGEFSILLKNSF